MKMRAINPDAPAPTSLRLASESAYASAGPTNWVRAAAYLLTFGAGALALLAVQRVLPHETHDAVAADLRGGLAEPIPLANDDVRRSLESQAESTAAPKDPGDATPEKPKSADASATAEAPAKHSSSTATSEPVIVVGVTEPAPGRYARLPLATSQAVAYLDVKPGDRVTKGLQVFSHYESPDRLQAVQAETEKSKKLLEVAKVRAAAAERTLARLDRLKTQATDQEREDAQTAADVRKQELAAAELAVTEAERRFKATEFEFKQAFVTSPIDGIVTSVDVVLGERRQVGNAFRGVTVLDPRVLYCRCMLTAEQIEKIGPAQNRDDTLDSAKRAPAPSAQPTRTNRVVVESQNRKYEAAIASVGAIADGSSGFIPVLVEVKNPDESLRVGVRAEVRFEEQIP
jgi:multidrug efflux pump subunit AcrA (membrane-fusion protein)